MDFELSPRVEELRGRVREFMREHVYPVEAEALRALDEEVRPSVPYPEVIVEVRERARSDGLWNLFMPGERYGAGLTNAEYGVLCEEMGRTAAAPAVFNCAAPDTGNMEILAEYGNEEQRRRWLDPLLAGDVRSCFSMTEPEVAGSDPTLLRTRAVRDGDSWVLNGHKWFTSGAVGARFAIA
ncbi:MAG: acyl-CoA dehydrogenase family protein, partial [Solirubrobacterales bacterium]